LTAHVRRKTSDVHREILVVDHAFHIRTRSTEPLIRLLQSDADEVLHIEPGEPDLLQLLRARPSHALVFVQLRPKPRLLRALGHPNVTWVPMRDDLKYNAPGVRHLSGSSIKFINFCREAHDVFSRRGEPSLGVTFWPEPPALQPRTQRAHPRIFLWDRGQVQWPLVKRLLGDQPVDSVVLRLAPDPRHQVARPSDDDIRRYRIEVVQGWLEQEEYRALLHGCDVFVSPRWLEGIGMAMLEAMAAGQTVLAPDRPTMNEYVVPGRNGWLFDPEQPTQVDLSGWKALGQQARQDCEAGAAEWSRQKHQIRPFVLAPSPRRERLWWRLAAWAGR
jgi:glycosyltransferase involved in cell wall biosynthesis